MFNRCFTILAFFCFYISFAQLTVVGDNYIFVDGDGFTDSADVSPLYVTNEVNLLGADSKIYLRNEAQLVQGSGSTGNSGVGELSVQQKGNANELTYNYWCSPVGLGTATSGNDAARVDLIDKSTGLISSVNATFTTAYDGADSPTSLTISNRWLYTFETSDEYSEWNALNEDTDIAPGLGFTMKGTDAIGGQLYEFRGKPNNGTIETNIAANQFTLIGNPYPSAIDALLLIHDPQNTNIDSAPIPYTPSTTGVLYYWDQTPTSHFTSEYVGGYGAYTISFGGMESFSFPTFYAYDSAGNPQPAPPGPGPNTLNGPKRYIPIGQGFMVEGATSTPINSKVFVKNEHRVFQKMSSGNSTFYRTDGSTEVSSENEVAYNEYGLNIVPEDYKRFRLNIIFNQDFTRQLLQNFHDTATDGFDYGLEAPSSDNATTDASWIQDEQAYVIQAHSFDLERVIPVVVKVEDQQPVDFSIFDVQNFDASQAIYLHDIDNGIYVDLTQQDYSINLPSGIYDDRFEITFQSETLSTDIAKVTDFDVYQNIKNAELTVLNPNGLTINTVNLVDTAGRNVIKSSKLGSQNEYRFSTKSLSDGVYIATITTNTNQTVSKKVIIKN
ncbi:T9SS type A sorting domain-containing protein [Psychroserpens sp.]|uniref:T9SS type A sorting domain-containing protein n=1 Tax=Psychroserpens sp. TaxID=2020870 RepID=UPI003C78AC38